MTKFKPTKKDREIIEASNIRGTVKEITYFDKNDKKYAIVINRIVNRIIINKTSKAENLVDHCKLYAIRLINHEDNENTLEIKAVKRFPDLIGFYSTKEDAKEAAKEIQENQELIDQCKYEFETQEDERRNILLIGRTGSGKSTLANVISGINSFGESAFLNSETKKFQSQDFE